MDNKFGFNFDNTYLNLDTIFYKKSVLNEVKNPKLVLLNENLAQKLQLNIKELKKDGVYILAGNTKVDGGAYISQAYAGHQFGYFTMLGDGRALLIGEHNLNDEKYEIQLKGSGKTAFSRNGDGRATLASTIREYIISEAMYYLGIPTTRSLAIVDSGEYILREDYEQGAILTRVAKSYIRFGTFEYANKFCDLKQLKELADYSINSYYPNLNNDENKYLKFFFEVLNTQANLIAKWQSVGFIHGVMNTDNMSIVGETIDYGPCAFMNIYNPDTVFSSIDRFGRYSYKSQPIICKWNLARLAEALAPLIDVDLEKASEKLEKELIKFNDIFSENYVKIMGNKLGIFNPDKYDAILIGKFLKILQENEYDYTNSFIELTKNIENPIYKDTSFLKWFKIWQERLNSQQKTIDDIQNLMKNSNPSFIPRNNLVEKAISNACNGDFEFLLDFLQELKTPFSHNSNEKFYTSNEELKKTYRTFCGT